MSERRGRLVDRNTRFTTSKWLTARKLWATKIVAQMFGNEPRRSRLSINEDWQCANPLNQRNPRRHKGNFLARCMQGLFVPVCAMRKITQTDNQILCRAKIDLWSWEKRSSRELKTNAKTILELTITLFVVWGRSLSRTTFLRRFVRRWNLVFNI